MSTTTKPAQPCDAELWVMAGKYPIPAQQFIDVARDVLNKFGAGQDAARAEPVVTLTGAQLLQALDFLAPDRDTDPTQLEGDATIAYGDGHAGKGYYCYFADCPDEGSTLLDAEAPDAPTALVSADPGPDQQRITAWAAVWFEINRLDPNAGRRAPKGVDCALSAIREWHRAASAPVAAPVSAEPVAEVVVNGDGSQTWVALRTQWLPSGRHKLYAAPVAAQAQPAFNVLAHLQRQRQWSERTFGPGLRTAGVCDHIRKELQEIEADPIDLREWVDVVILALDGAWRTGATPQQIIDAIVAKQVKNEGRVWPDWRTVDPNKAIEHDRSGEAQAQQPASGDDGLPIELRGISEAIGNGGGFWRSCSGCHELNEGHDTGPRSKVFGCALGNGCSECGGIGAIWDTTDYDAMADFMAAKDQQHTEHTETVACGCGDLYPTGSYGAGFIAAAGHCENCDAAKGKVADKVDADPLQGAADWLVKDCGVKYIAALARHLSIGYNRATRLMNAARNEAGHGE